VAGIEGIRSLRFQLSARTVAIDATTEALMQPWPPSASLALPKPVSAAQAATKTLAQ
jgi:Cd2+/Zn2+-exporting ATPase